MKLELASNIRKFRRERGMTQERLAEALGVTVGAVSKWESASSIPDIMLIVQMADLFETSVDVLLGYSWKGGSLADALERMRAHRNAKDFDQATAEAEKMLERWPNSFEAAYKSAIMYTLKGIERKDKRSLERSLMLYRRSLELIKQNTDNEINEWSIKNDVAKVYLLMGDQERALEELKRNNVAGLNNAFIGDTMAKLKRDPDGALTCLSDALYDHFTTLLRVTQGFSNAYQAKGEFESAIAAMRFMYDLTESLRGESVSYLDRVSAQIACGLAELEMIAGSEAGARGYLALAKRHAQRFDAAPTSTFENARFFHSKKGSTAFDDFGATAMDGIGDNLREDEDVPKAILDIWEEIKNDTNE